MTAGLPRCWRPVTGPAPGRYSAKGGVRKCLPRILERPRKAEGMQDCFELDPRVVHARMPGLQHPGCLERFLDWLTRRREVLNAPSDRGMIGFPSVARQKRSSQTKLSAAVSHPDVHAAFCLAAAPCTVGAATAAAIMAGKCHSLSREASLVHTRM